MRDSPSVLIVEDDANIRLGCTQALQLEGIAVIAADSAEQALAMLQNHEISVVVTDIRLPNADGLWLLDQLVQHDRDLPVVLMTGHGDISMAVQAMKRGALDFLEKPFQPEYLVEVVRKGIERRNLTLELRQLRYQVNHRDGIEARILGRSPVMKRVARMVTSLAATSADILIEGETGTGKELVAQCLHDASPRRAQNFVAINCAGLPESLFESEIFGHEAGAFTGATKRRIGKIEHAAGGTLFLDEIESMPLTLQVKLLRVLQERRLERLGSNVSIPVDFRVIAATKSDLGVLSEQGRFRADLYYRLNVAVVRLPPLRERREDIGLLFETFAIQAAARHNYPVIPPDHARLQRLMEYQWPGNVRELRNVADRYVLGIEGGFPPFGTAIAEDAENGRSLADTVEAFERAVIAEALRRHAQNLTRTSEVLRVAKSTLHDKIRRYGLLG